MLYIKVTKVDTGRHARFYEGHVEPADCDAEGDLYRALVKEYGRCTSKMYVDLKAGGTRQVGWVFVKREEYTDAHRLPKKERTFLCETWVEVFDGPPQFLPPPSHVFEK